MLILVEQGKKLVIIKILSRRQKKGKLSKVSNIKKIFSTILNLTKNNEFPFQEVKNF